MAVRRTQSVAEPELTVISWRSIPAQVVARYGIETMRAELPGRFLAAIDRAAMREGLTGSDAYLEQWQRHTRTCGTDLRAEVDAEVAALEARYSMADLNALVDAAGWDQR
jgi:hypothetical protein